MTLKNTRLARAEDLTAELRATRGLPDTGLVIIESHNTNLHEKIVSAESGIRNYLLSLGDFKKGKLPE